MRAYRMLPCFVMAWALAACDARPPAATPEPGTFRFAVLGDAPYHGLDHPRYRVALEQIDAAPLEFVIHVGDILWYPCDEKTYRNRLAGFEGLRHALVYTPGDNEWADCHEDITGGYTPLERLATLRRIFFAEPHESLGARAIALASQGALEPYAEFVENARWQHDGVVFTTVHLPGSWNAGAVYPARTRADAEATTRRTAAAVHWLERAFDTARETQARALVIATHADMKLAAAPDNDYQRSFAPFVERLEALVAATDLPVLLVHGDSHEYTVDQPLRDRRDGRELAALTRLQVMGAPDIGWVEVTVTRDREKPFRFTPHHVPWWKWF